MLSATKAAKVERIALEALAKPIWINTGSRALPRSFDGPAHFRLDLRGWWLTLIGLCVLFASTLLTYAHHDILEMYRLMDMPQAQIDQVQTFGFLQGNGMLWMMSLCILLFLGYLFFIKRYLRPR